ncbi:type I restriction-modification system specificity determinant protein [Staphylococcus xylosus]|uniref:restriction endonuclease subunit S n=1 Tax=Staphylococcus xylosus TaxID=1288 RepID=UPI000499F522|nr:restriction endonuclease subunit S [Staphylococcus xylosus]AID02733.1 type I restriction-modification system specificity determinant protein [Staphylococcus xylosus]
MEYKVSEVVKIISGGTPKRKNSEYWNGEIPWLSVKDFNNKNRLVHETEEQITEAGLNNSAATLVSKGTVVISARGTVGELCQVAKSMTFNQSCFGLEAISKYTTNEYIYYWFKYKTNYIKSNTHGSVFDTINRKTFENLYIYLPNISYQKQVVNILKTLDNKIEINQNIIANLEELSQTLFKRWFVDFEFPDENGNPYKSNGGEMVDSELGAIPKGWNVKNLDDIANYMNGLAMQKFKPTDNQNSLPVVKIKELKNGSTDENSNRCTSEIPEKALIVDGDIIFSWSATLLVKMWCGGKAGLNQHLFKVSSDKYPKWFYYYWTKRYIDYFIGIANDKATTMGHINRKHLSHAKILTPNDQTLEKFSRTFDDLLEKELSVSKESKRLTELRDTLLPKLMSGEIEIPDDIEVNEDELSI